MIRAPVVPSYFKTLHHEEVDVTKISLITANKLRDKGFDMQESTMKQLIYPISLLAKGVFQYMGER